MTFSHTHCQAAQVNRTIQSLSISVSEPTHGQKRKSTIAQHCIRAMAAAVVKSRSVHLINFCGGGQVIASKSATAHNDTQKWVLYDFFYRDHSITNELVEVNSHPLEECLPLSESVYR